MATNINPGVDVIDFDLPPNSVITLNGTELPAIVGGLTINGGSADNLTISGNNASRVFLIVAASRLDILVLEKGMKIACEGEGQK